MSNTGERGITFMKNRYHVAIGHGGKMHRLGVYRNLKDAIAVRDTAIAVYIVNGEKPLPPVKEGKAVAVHGIVDRKKKKRVPWNKKPVEPNRRLDGTFKNTKRNKFNAQGRRVNGLWCASGAEARRYEQLIEMLDKGMIADLETQVPYPCHVKGALITTYRADFRYKKIEAGRFPVPIIEEVKGKKTVEYIIKKKLVEAVHGIRILEVNSKSVTRMRFLTALDTPQAMEASDG